MKQFSQYSHGIKKQTSFTTYYAYKEGVFETPRGKFVARVPIGKNKKLTTLSQHDTIEQAQLAYDSFYKNLQR